MTMSIQDMISGLAASKQMQGMSAMQKSGYDAYFDGITLAGNPGKSEADRHEWSSGWFAARIESS